MAKGFGYRASPIELSLRRQSFPRNPALGTSGVNSGLRGNRGTKGVTQVRVRAKDDGRMLRSNGAERYIGINGATNGAWGIKGSNRDNVGVKGGTSGINVGNQVGGVWIKDGTQRSLGIKRGTPYKLGSDSGGGSGKVAGDLGIRPGLQVRPEIKSNLKGIDRTKCVPKDDVGVGGGVKGVNGYMLSNKAIVPRYPDGMTKTSVDVDKKDQLTTEKSRLPKRLSSDLESSDGSWEGYECGDETRRELPSFDHRKPPVKGELSLEERQSCITKELDNLLFSMEKTLGSSAVNDGDKAKHEKQLLEKQKCLPALFYYPVFEAVI